MPDLTPEETATAQGIARQWLEHGADMLSSGPHETPVITDGLVNLIAAALAENRRATEDRIVKWLRDGRAVKWLERHPGTTWPNDLATAIERGDWRKEKPDET